MPTGFVQGSGQGFICVNLQTSFLTQPFGYALFYFYGVAREGYTMNHIYKGILPFEVLQVVSLVLITLFLALLTWLPSVQGVLFSITPYH